MDYLLSGSVPTTEHALRIHHVVWGFHETIMTAKGRRRGCVGHVVWLMDVNITTTQVLRSKYLEVGLDGFRSLSGVIRGYKSPKNKLNLETGGTDPPKWNCLILGTTTMHVNWEKTMDGVMMAVRRPT